ncbi:MerR family transcriptional regulator [Microbacterium sp. HD4P20]|uniref:MerR family transcriptional regulator n=1 Tax=Microbacterium sp. HD4P20 TaxID=2864874 RepID=UPI001C63CFC3|nr:MerR family transcriptional regulator [Microbacterium sp. HD4P20]MCP2637227.1 MerR family transcriptional regulator [Microbacterium sp. HD4P20]
MATYTPAEAAAISGFSLDTLRYYEREGILPPVARTAGGHRAFSDADLGTLGFLKCLRETGMPIERLRRYGELCRDDRTIPDRIALLEEHAAAVRRELNDLLAQQAKLDGKLEWYRGELERRGSEAGGPQTLPA